MLPTVILATPFDFEITQFPVPMHNRNCIHKIEKESAKAQSMENASTWVLDRNKDAEIKPKNCMMY